MTTTLKLAIRLITLIIVLTVVIFLGLKIFGSSKSNEPVITHNMVLQQVTAIGKLELVKYHFKDVVEYQKEQSDYSIINNVLPKAKVVLIVSGEAIGCIDLTKITTNDISDSKDTMYVYLAKPEMCVNKIDHQQSKVYDLANGYFVEKGKMVSDAYAAAETQIQQSALKMGILEQTNENAVKILGPMLEKIAGKKVALRFKK
jgi:Protein of unknown function (DUF4230)